MEYIWHIGFSLSMGQLTAQAFYKDMNHLGMSPA